jgi:hypothetical protein
MLWITAIKTWNWGPYVTWIGVMIGALTVVTIAILAIRGRLLGKDAGGVQKGMLDDLRAMRDRGEMTQAEFDAARAAMIARLAPGRAGAPASARPVPAASSGSKGLIAKPGFDLTGRPLPKAPGERPGQ